MPTVSVRRLELMRLIYRYKGLLEWELACLQELEGEFVELDLGAAPEPAPLGEFVPEGGSGTVRAMPRVLLPGNLETSCVINQSIGDYVELVDAATPLVRALAEPG